MTTSLFSSILSIAFSINNSSFSIVLKLSRILCLFSPFFVFLSQHLTLPEPVFTKSVYAKRDYFKSKDVYIFGRGGLEIQFRTFPAFQGEIIGKSAKHGKISGDGGPRGPIGIVMKQVGADPIPARKEITAMIRRERDKFFAMFYNEYVRSGGKVGKEEFIKNYDKKDTGYLESKYLGTLMLNNLKGREQKFLTLAFAYAKNFKTRFILGCGMIIDGIPKLLPLVLNNKGNWIGKLV